MIAIAKAEQIDIKTLAQRVHYENAPRAEEVLGYCLAISDSAWTGSVDGKIACIWGLIPPTLMSTQAYLWLSTTELVTEHQFLFVRHSQRMIERMLQDYDVIVGHVEASNARAIRWLRWLGAEFRHTEDGKINFSIRKKNG